MPRYSSPDKRTQACSKRCPFQGCGNVFPQRELRKAVVLFMSLLLAACYETESEREGLQPPRTVVLTEATSVGGNTTQAFIGTVQSSERVRLAFAQSGTIDVISVDIGDRVTPRADLATLELQPFERRREQVQAGLDQAAATFNEVQQRHAAQQRLAERGFFPRLAFESTTAQLEAARADLHAGQAELELAERTVREARIMSPIGGTVAQRMAEPGEFVRPGQTIFEIDGEGALEAVIPVPSALATELSLGTDVVLSTPGLSAEGSVLRVGERQGRGGLVIVEVLIAGQIVGLTPGGVVEARFVLEEPQDEMVQIPLSSFLPGVAPNTGAVFAFDSHTRRVNRLDVVAIPAGAEQIHTPSLARGTLVVSAGVRFLNDGDLVNPLPVTAE